MTKVVAASFVVCTVKAPVVVVVGWRNISCEFITNHSGVIAIRDVIVAYFVSISEQNVNSVIMFQEFSYFVGVGVDIFVSFVDPMVWLWRMY